MGTAVSDYRTFLDRFHHSAEELVPTMVVDLVWHTHMLHPQRRLQQRQQNAHSILLCRC